MSIHTYEVTESKITCHRTLGSRVGIGILGGLFSGLCLILLCGFWPFSGSLADRSPAQILDRSVFLLLTPLVGLCGPTAIFLYEAGPKDLIVDTVQPTYWFRRGFPLLASWQSGPLTDIADLRVKTVKDKIGTKYLLLLDWKNTDAAPWTLGDGPVSGRRPFQMLLTRDADEAREEVRRLAPRLGVPIRETEPALEQTRRETQVGIVLMPAMLWLALLGLVCVLKPEEQPAQGRVTVPHPGQARSVRQVYPVDDRRN